jgi:type I restriction enzyme R subunit
MDLLLPDVRALDYVPDLRWLGKIREIAAARYRDERRGPDVRDASEKVRKLIDEAVVADGVQILIERVSLFSADFEKKLGALKSDEARASEIEHAIRHEIHVKLDEDPAFYQSLRKQLEQIIQDAKQRRIDAALQLSLLQTLTDTLRGRAKIASEHGPSDSGFAIYGLLNGVGLADGKAPTDEHGGDRVRDVAQAISLALQPHTALLDWRDKGEVQREMRRTIKRLLPSEIFAKDSHERIAEAIVNLLKAQRRA